MRKIVRHDDKERGGMGEGRKRKIERLGEREIERILRSKEKDRETWKGLERETERILRKKQKDSKTYREREDEREEKKVRNREGIK